MTQHRHLPPRAWPAPNCMARWAVLRRSIVGGETSLVIPICLGSGEQIGSLAAVTAATIVDDSIVDALTRWRSTFRRFFLTQFSPTPERTRAWLRSIIDDERRMLFTIHTGDTLIGNYGFRDLNEHSAELDNLLRGERGGHPAIMKHAVLTLTHWLFSSVGVASVFGNILADNAVALKLHVDAGFRLGEMRPLTLHTTETESRLTIGVAGEKSPNGKYYQQVILDAPR